MEEKELTEELPENLEEQPGEEESFAEEMVEEELSEEVSIEEAPADEDLEPKEAEDRGFSAVRTVFEYVETFCIALSVMIVLFLFFFRNVTVDGDSMLPTLQDGNWLVVSAFDASPDCGDIVIVTQPNQTSTGGPIVKRVIAVGGQTVDIDFDHGIVYVDGKELDEPYILEKNYRSFDVSFPLTVPEGFLFVMGDNRNDSLDSRSSRIGLIDERYVLGKAVMRILPVGDSKIYD